MMTRTYLRWRQDQPRLSDVKHPLTSDHPSFDAKCLVCVERLGNGQPVQLLVLGPEDAEDRALHQAMRWYSAVALILHAACAGGES